MEAQQAQLLDAVQTALAQTAAANNNTAAAATIDVCEAELPVVQGRDECGPRKGEALKPAAHLSAAPEQSAATSDVCETFNIGTEDEEEGKEIEGKYAKDKSKIDPSSTGNPDYTDALDTDLVDLTKLTGKQGKAARRRVKKTYHKALAQEIEYLRKQLQA